MRQIYLGLQNLISPPSFEDSTENNLAKVGNFILIVAILVSTFLLIYYYQLGAWRYVLGTGIAIPCGIWAKVLLHKRKLLESFVVLVVVGTGVTAVQSLLGQGINDIGILIFFPMLIVAAFKFKDSWYVFILLAISVWFVFAYWLEINGFYEARPEINGPTMKFVFGLSMIAVSVAMLQFAIRQLVDSNKKLSVLKDAADGANLAKSEFLANMSHEFRTPLNAILGYAEDIYEESKEGELRIDKYYLENTDQIIKAGQSLLALINGVLDLSKIEASVLELSPQPIQLNSMVHELTTLLQPIAQKNKNQFKCQIHSVQSSLTTDEAILTRVLINLLSNAMKFTSNGKIELEVKDNFLKGKAAISFLVKDNGIGISPDQHDLIFQPFLQVDGSLTRQQQGTGLGLAISRRMVTLLEGEIKVESDLGKGSIFTLTVPTSLSSTGLYV